MVLTKTIKLDTDPSASTFKIEIVEITPQVEAIVIESGLSEGNVTLFVTGSTAALATVENEPGLLSDFESMWERVVPRNIPYNHDRAWGEGNGYSHVRASLLGASLVIPFTERKMALGTWQQIVLVDFDNRARSRQVVAQVIGE